MNIRKDNDRPSVQVVGSTVYLRASKLGACVRSIAAEIMGRQGAGRSQMLEDTAQEGHLHERDMEKRIGEKWGMELVDRQGECESTYYIGSWTFVITGHYEGKWAKAGIPVFGWENKAMSKDQFPLWERSLERDKDGRLHPTFKNHQSYAWQISHYMLCMGLPVLYTVKNRNRGNHVEVILETPPHSREDIEARLAEIVAILEHPKRVDSPSHCSPDAQRWFCPYRDFLSCMDTKNPGTSYEEVFDPELEDALMVYEAAKRQRSAAETEMKKARAIIEKRAPFGSVVTLMGFTASWSKTSVEDREALKRFLAEHGKTLNDFKKEGKRLSTGGPK